MLNGEIPSVEFQRVGFHNGPMRRELSRNAFTLIELLVVIAVISILVGLTLPAVQAVRQSAQNLSCKNNLKNIGLAVANYQSALTTYPPSFEVPLGETVRGSWSVHAQIMPYMEEANAYRRIDFSTDWHFQVDSGIPAYAVPVYTCPSEPNPIIRQKDGQDYVYGTNYGFNMGSWFIFDPTDGANGDGAFRVNQATRPRDFQTDGTSNTLCAVDVKMYTSYVRNVDSINPELPSTPDFFEGTSGELKLGSDFEANTGHTVWCDGRVHHTGFTTVYTPNTRVNYTIGEEVYDIDYSSQQEGRSTDRNTYAAVTARSYHSQGVNAVCMDGSVRTVNDTIAIDIWRALGTANNGEVIDGRQWP